MAKIVERDKTGRTVQLNNVRLSFTDSLHTAKLPKKAEPGAKPTHSVNCILERGGADFEANKAVIVSALQAASKEFKKPENYWKQLFEDDPKQCAFRKGERFKSDSGEVYAGYEGNLVVVAKGPSGGMKRPKILDRLKRDVAVDDIPDVCYGGTYADVQISWYGTDKGGTSRITCSIEVIRSRQEGERMGGGGAGFDADDWDDMGEDDSFDSAPAAKAAAAVDLDF